MELVINYGEFNEVIKCKEWSVDSWIIITLAGVGKRLDSSSFP